MHKKKVLTLGPVSAQPEDIAAIAQSLAFLDEDYRIDYLDSLSIMHEVPNQDYYQLWQQKLASYLDDYDAFFGFSFGGVILQQCFSLFAKTPKAIILFSTPTFADPALQEKLGTVIRLCQEDKLEEALKALYQPVFYPHKMPALTLDHRNKAQAYARLIFGLTRVLNTDARAILQENKVPHLHLIGADSNLVNRHNVLAANHGRLISVPHASMRMLQDEPIFCQKVILEALNNAFL